MKSYIAWIGALSAGMVLAALIALSALPMTVKAENPDPEDPYDGITISWYANTNHDLIFNDADYLVGRTQTDDLGFWWITPDWSGLNGNLPGGELTFAVVARPIITDVGRTVIVAGGIWSQRMPWAPQFKLAGSLVELWENTNGNISIGDRGQVKPVPMGSGWRACYVGGDCEIDEVTTDGLNDYFFDSPMYHFLTSQPGLGVVQHVADFRAEPPSFRLGGQLWDDFPERYP